MIIDNEGRLFGKINIIDLCVILVLIAAVALAYVKFGKTNTDNNTETNATIIYTLKVTNVRDYTAKQFIVGENIYDDETGKCIGVISNVVKKPNKDYVQKTDGTEVISPRPNRFDLYITAETKGTVDNTGYYAGGVKQLSPHSTIILSNKRFKTHSNVYSISKK